MTSSCDITPEQATRSITVQARWIALDSRVISCSASPLPDLRCTSELEVSEKSAGEGASSAARGTSCARAHSQTEAESESSETNLISSALLAGIDAKRHCLINQRRHGSREDEEREALEEEPGRRRMHIERVSIAVRIAGSSTAVADNGRTHATAVEQQRRQHHRGRL